MRSLKYVVPVCLLVAWSLCCSQAKAGTTPLTTELFASGLQRPVGLTAPDGDFSRVFVD